MLKKKATAVIPGWSNSRGFNMVCDIHCKLRFKHQFALRLLICILIISNAIKVSAINATKGSVDRNFFA